MYGIRASRRASVWRRRWPHAIFFSVLQNSFCVKICTTDVCKCFAFMPYIYYMPVCASASVLICRVCAGAAYGWLHADAKLHRGVTCVCVRARSFRFIRAWHIRWMLIAYQFWSGLGSGSGTVRVAKMKCNGMRRVTWDSVNVIQNNNNKKCDAFFSFGWQTDGNDYSSEVDGDVEDGVMNELELLMAARHMSSVSEVEFLKSKYSPKWHEWEPRLNPGNPACVKLPARHMSRAILFCISYIHNNNKYKWTVLTENKKLVAKLYYENY